MYCHDLEDGDYLFAKKGQKKGLFLEVDGFDDFLDAVKVKVKIHPDGDNLYGKSRGIAYCSWIGDMYEVLEEDELEDKVSEEQMKDSMNYLAFLDGVDDGKPKQRYFERKAKELEDEFDLDFEIDVGPKDVISGQSGLDLF